MRRLSGSLLFLFLFVFTWAQEHADSTKVKELGASVRVSLNSNGIAYIPAFSLGEPAIIAAISLSKGRFSYDPILNYGLDLKPWIIDNWFHYKIIDRPAFEFKTGAVFSAFFSEIETGEDPILQVQKYLAVEFISTYKFNSNSSLAFTYLLDRGQDPGTLKGHFFNLQAERSDFQLGKKGLLSASLQLFYINYTGEEDGLFAAANISASIRDIPLSLFFQAIQVITSNITPEPEFKWNVGLAYSISTPD